MDLWQAIILSVVEGITEFLPVSSTGHLVLAARLLSVSQTEFVKSFEIIIQFGAILAVVVLYRKTLMRENCIWKPILWAFLPTSIIGFVLYTLIKRVLIGNVIVTVWALGAGGLVLIILELLNGGKEKDGTIKRLSWKQSALIGLIQSLSIVPGVSRAAASIIGGMAVGLSRSEAVAFSFFLAIPTMAAATSLDLVKSSMVFSANEWMLLGAGFLGSFFTALVAVKTFLHFIRSHTFLSFGIYRILVAGLFWIFFR